MKQPERGNTLHAPLMRALAELGFGDPHAFRHLDTGSLAWTTGRLFESYERVATLLTFASQHQGPLGAEIGHFIIRLRVVLNDVAFVVRQLLPDHARDCAAGAVQGGTPFAALAGCLRAAGPAYVEIARACAAAAQWADPLCRLHWQLTTGGCKVAVLHTLPPAYALLAPGDGQDGGTGKEAPLEGIDELVDANLVRLYVFMHRDLDAAVRAHTRRLGVRRQVTGPDASLTAVGISRFRERNGPRLSW